MISEKTVVPKVLVVDDVVETLDLIKTYLETFEKIEVITCQNGNDAIDEFINSDFALILLDVDMPNMDGFEVARKMRELKKENPVPIIYITGCDREGKRAATGYEVGAVDYILKPFNMEFLLSKVKVFINLYYQRKKLEEEIVDRVLIENELKQSNENVKSIIDGAPECICTLSKNGKVEAINQAGLTLLCVSNIENVQGAFFAQWVTPKDKAVFIDAIEKANLGKEVSISISLQTVTNEIRFVDFTIAPLINKDEIKGLIGLAIDVTQKTLAKSKKTRGRTTSHHLDVNGIIKPITQSTEVEVNVEEKVKENVNNILKPMLEKLKSLSPENSPYYDLMSNTMNEITNSLDDIALKEFKNLNGKEIEVFTLFKQGLTNKQIAERLNKSERNISLYLSKITKKLGLSKKKV